MPFKKPYLLLSVLTSGSIDAEDTSEIPEGGWRLFGIDDTASSKFEHPEVKDVLAMPMYKLQNILVSELYQK